MANLGIRTDAGGTFGALTLGGVDKVTINTNGITPESLAQKLTLGTAQATTSGTAKDFTAIPSWVKRITLTLRGVSASSAADFLVRIGTGGVLVTSGYDTNKTAYTSAPAIVPVARTTSIAEFSTSAAGAAVDGQIVLTLLDSNIWVAVGQGFRKTDNISFTTAGSVALGGSLDIVSILTSTGTFDAGSVNILYEG